MRVQLTSLPVCRVLANVYEQVSRDLARSILTKRGVLILDYQCLSCRADNDMPSLTQVYSNCLNASACFSAPFRRDLRVFSNRVFRYRGRPSLSTIAQTSGMAEALLTSHFPGRTHSQPPWVRNPRSNETAASDTVLHLSGWMFCQAED